MAVVFDAVGPSSGTSSATSGAIASNATASIQTSWTHTAGSGANRAVIVAVAVGLPSPGSSTVTASVTYGGTAMTTLGSVKNAGVIDGFTQLFGLAAPAAGASTVVAKATNSSTTSITATLVASSTSFTGAAQSSTFGTAATGADTNASQTATPTVSLTGTDANGMVADAVGAGSSISSSNKTLRARNNYSGSSGGGYGASSTSASAAGTVTMSYAMSGADYWGIVAVEIKSAAGGSTYAGAATLAATSSTSISALAETAAAAAPLAGSSATTATATGSLVAAASLGGVSSTAATGSLGAQAAATTGSTSGTTAGGAAGTGITIPATSGTAASAGAIEQAQATLAGTSSVTTSPRLAAVASATLAATSGQTLAPFETERTAAVLAASSGSTFTVFAVRPAVMTTASASGATGTARLGASVTAVLVATSGFSFTSGPPTAPAAAVLAAVSALGGAGWIDARNTHATITAVSTLAADGVQFTPPFVYPTGPVVPQVANPTWQLLAFDTMTGRVGYELPWSSLSWSSKLNDAGSLTATIQVQQALASISSVTPQADDPRVELRSFLTGPYRYSLAVAYGSVLLWAGPYLPASAAPDKPTVDIAGVEFAKLLDKRVMVNPSGDGPLTDSSNDLVFAGTTLPGLVYQIVQTAITGDGRSLPITCANVPDLVGTETQSYNGYDLTTVWKALQDVAARDGGPDIRFDPYLITGGDGLYVNYELRIGDPYIDGSGPLGPNGPMPWTWDESVAQVTPSVDATGLATDYYVPGSGQDRAKLIGTASSNTLRRLGWPVLEVVDGQHSSETDQSNLDSFAVADVVASAGPAVSWAVKVPSDHDPPAGEFRPGDLVRLDVDRNLYLAPDSYIRRITQLSGDGSRSLSMTVVDDDPVKDTDTDMAAVAHPLNLTAVVDSANEIVLSWDAVPGASSYRIYETESPAGVATVTGTRSVRGPFSTYRTYTYWVTGLVNGTETAVSNAAVIDYKAAGSSTSGGTGSSGSATTTTTLGNPASAAWQTIWAANNVNDGGNLQDASYNWQSTTPYVTSSRVRSGGHALRLDMPANGASNPASGASADSAHQRCEMQPNVAEFSAGQTGYFRLDVELLAGFPIGTTTWQTISQWKNDGTGSPPVELMVGRNVFYLQGHDSSGNETWRYDLASATTGTTREIVVGITFGSSTSAGTVSAWVDGNVALAPTKAATCYSGVKSYWKFGCYRDSAITQASSLIFDRAVYGTSYANVK